MTMNKMHVIQTLICFVYLKKKESGLLVSGMSIVWEDTNGCAKQYRCALDIYLMTVVIYPYGIIMDISINSPGYGKNVFDGLNATYKHYLKGGWKLLVNYKVTIPKILEFFPVLQNMSPLNFQTNVYTF